MKRTVLICLILVTAFTGRAQLFGPESLNGAFWGSLIGGLAGGNRHHGFSGDGAAIGAGVGLLAGAIAGESRRYDYYDSPGYAYYPASSVSVGYGYGRRGSSAYVYYAPNRYCAPGYYYQPTYYQTYQPARQNYAVNGTLLGAASGALIGASQHDAGKGAAIGAGAGLVLGAIAEHSAQRQERRAAAQTQYIPVPQTYSSQTEAPRQPESLRQSQVTSKPAPNSTYHWSAPPAQISDAPRVPDAPTF